MRVSIRQEELRGWSSTGVVFRAYDADDGFPLHLGEETREALVQRVLENYPKAVILPEGQ